MKKNIGKLKMMNRVIKNHRISGDSEIYTKA